MPFDRLEIRGVAVQQAIAGEHEACLVADFPVERAELCGYLPVVADRQHLYVRRERRQVTLRRALCERVVPLAEQPSFGDEQPAESGLRACSMADRPAGRDRLA